MAVPKSTGIALHPISISTRKLVRFNTMPVGWCHSAYIRHQGLVDYIDSVAFNNF